MPLAAPHGGGQPGLTNQAPLRPLPVFLLFIFAGALFTWPAPLYLFTGIPFGYDIDRGYSLSKLFIGDHFQAYYHLGLFKKAAIGEIAWFSNPLEFSVPFLPERVSTYFLPVSIFYLPFALVSEPFGYNALIFVSFGLTGLAAYLWITEISGSRAAGLMGGAIYNFLPLRLVELYGGHPAGHAIFLFPLILFFFDRAVKKKSVSDSAMAGLLAFGFSYQYQFFLYYLMMFLLAYAPWRVVPAALIAWRESKGGEGASLKKLTIAALPFLIGLLAGAYNILSYKAKVVGQTTFKGGRTYDEVANFSPPLSAIYEPGVGYSVYLGVAGIGALLAILYTFWLFIARKKSARKHDLLFFALVFLGSYHLAFGTSADGLIPLYSFFYKFFPGFKYSRTPAKIMVLAAAAAMALVGLLAAEIMEKKKRGGMVALILFALLIIIDFHPGKAVGVALLDEDNTIYQTLKEAAAKEKAEPGQKVRVVMLPLWPGEAAWTSLYQYYTLQSGVPMVNGYSPAVAADYIEKVFRPLAAINGGDLSGKEADLLLSFGARFLIFHEEAYPQKVSAFPPRIALQKLLNNPRLTLIEGSEPIWLFKILDTPREKAAPASPSPSPIGLFWQAEWLRKIDGKVADDQLAGNGKAVVVTKGAPGLLNAGPYKTFPAGDYRAIFTLRADGAQPKKEVAILDVTGEQGKTEVAKKILYGHDFTSGGYEQFAVEFSLPPGYFWQLEFRVHATGKAEVAFDHVYALPQGRPIHESRFEAEEMYYIGKIISDKEASGGQAVVARPGVNPLDDVVKGPGRLFGKGRYRATFVMKGSKGEGSDVAAIVAVRRAGDRKSPVAIRKVTRSEITGGYRPVRLDFDLPHEDALSFVVTLTGQADLYIDRTDIADLSAKKTDEVTP